MPRRYRTPINSERTEVLRRAIERSGHRTLASFAREELVRDPRTVRTWLNETFPIPAIVMPRLEALARKRADPEGYQWNWQSLGTQGGAK